MLRSKEGLAQGTGQMGNTVGCLGKVTEAKEATLSIPHPVFKVGGKKRVLFWECMLKAQLARHFSVGSPRSAEC